MGAAGDGLAVVDTQCRVNGVQRLRVIDASCMPTITSGNTNAPTIMLAQARAAVSRGLTLARDSDATAPGGD